MRIEPASLTKLADEIDGRIGPIPGPRADHLAVVLRAAASQLGGIKHPTGSEEFAGQLESLAVPAPWRLCDEEIGEVLAANGDIACIAGADSDPDEDRSALAMYIILAVNTLAGFKAQIP